MATSLYSAQATQKAIWVFLEETEGVLEGVSLELLAKGRTLADQVGWRLAGLLLGHNVHRLVPEVFTHGADEVWLAEHPLLQTFTVEAFTRIAFQAVMEGKPSVFLCGATPNGRDLAGRLAVRARTGLTADCTNLQIHPETGVMAGEVTGFGGGVMALIEMQNTRPQMATVRPGVFAPGKPDASRSGQVILLPVDLTSTMVHTRIVERVTREETDLTHVPVLVVGGRGVAQGFPQLQELASLLGGEVGGTRPVVDAGIIPRERQIGQTGVICRPKVAILCGVSGAFQLVVGVDKAEVVVAINSDPKAPIFEYADYCIVADASHVLPALIDALRALREVVYA